jgi:hypothetical protein
MAKMKISHGFKVLRWPLIVLIVFPNIPSTNQTGNGKSLLNGNLDDKLNWNKWKQISLNVEFIRCDVGIRVLFTWPGLTVSGLAMPNGSSNRGTGRRLQKREAANCTGKWPTLPSGSSKSWRPEMGYRYIRYTGIPPFWPF